MCVCVCREMGLFDVCVCVCVQEYMCVHMYILGCGLVNENLYEHVARKRRVLWIIHVGLSGHIHI